MHDRIGKTRESIGRNKAVVVEFDNRRALTRKRATRLNFSVAGLEVR
jgi:hypothetical protein